MLVRIKKRKRQKEHREQAFAWKQKKKRIYCKFSAKCLYDSENSLKFMAQKDEMSVINFIN